MVSGTMIRTSGRFPLSKELGVFLDFPQLEAMLTPRWAGSLMPWHLLEQRFRYSKCGDTGTWPARTPTSLPPDPRGLGRECFSSFGLSAPSGGLKRGI